MSIEAIFSIVGICVGALSAAWALTGCCIMCIQRCGYCKDDEPGVVEGTSGDQAEGVALQEETTKV